ncbi:MAG: YihY/virulence factor BrkB family protein [Rhodospirillales bacterium]|nr:YihY/virulence factor BrkB family protein [Rhodospirillales bacterium]
MANPVRRQRQPEEEPRPEAKVRGREADSPSQIPSPGWRDVALRVWENLSRKNIPIIAAGVAYYGLFSIFPALAALISVYGLVVDPATVEQQVSSLTAVIPAEAQGILADQMKAVSSSSGTGLGLGLVVSVLVALWTATQGTKASMTALNVVYEEPEQRGFLRFTATALALTAGGILFVIVALALVAVLPAVLKFIGLGGVTEILLQLGRWPVLGAMVMLALAVVYRYAPSRDMPRWRWVSWGAAVATVLWLAGSGLFSYYVSHFGSYNKTYGSVGAVVVLLLWMYLSAFVVLLGGMLNAELEHQTARDSTVGQPKPMGQRNARMADTLGKGGKRR